MSYETLDVCAETDSLWVTLNRPGRRNGLRGRTRDCCYGQDLDRARCSVWPVRDGYVT